MQNKLLYKRQKSNRKGVEIIQVLECCYFIDQDFSVKFNHGKSGIYKYSTTTHNLLGINFVERLRCMLPAIYCRSNYKRYDSNVDMPFKYFILRQF